LGAEPDQEKDRFGTLEIVDSTLSFNLAQPTVYSALDSIQINGQAHDRFTYLWCYSLKPAATGSLSLQGVRITPDSKGFPVIWEVLKDPSGTALIFVAQSLETAAASQYSKPLPGRRFVIEAKPTKDQNVIVPRILDDGPVPMGPMLYLKAE